MCYNKSQSRKTSLQRTRTNESVMVTSVAATQSSYRFPYIKFTVLLIVILKYELCERRETFRDYFQRDFNFCTDCFQSQITKCEKFFNAIEYDIASNPWRNFVNLLPKNGKRANEFLKYKHNSTHFIAKYITQRNIETIPSSPITIARLRQQFVNAERLDGVQFCPSERITRFIDYMKHHTQGSSSSIWLHLMLNIEPLLMPHLEQIGFPVPMSFAVCGFTLYQANVGKALIYYYDADFALKLRIAKQLLDAAIKFSMGFAAFRIYITDLSPDNLVFDELNQKLYLVDLDTVLIVDSSAEQLKTNSTHKHLYIDCDNCFAYSQQDICSYGLSDINLFSACQLLRENLSREQDSGFLYPIPKDVMKSYPQFQQMLDNCVDCSDVQCENRFAATLDLIELFNVILENFY